MWRTLTLLSLLLSVPTLRAQTHFYLNGITVLPTAPTTSDAVTLLLSGDLSDTGASVDQVQVDANDFTVSITMVASSIAGLSVLVPHVEHVPLGYLEAGTWTVVITEASTGVLDLAPVPEHSFVVIGGEYPCAQVQAQVMRHPFTDTALVVHAQHNTMEVFSHPSFVVYDAQGNTLATEIPIQFSLAQDHWSVLPLATGQSLPAGAFTGVVELWVDQATNLACTWPYTIAPCPPPPCAPLYPTISNLGSATVLGDFSYMINDQHGQTMATGTWQLTETEQFRSDSICLPPGHYTMQVFPQQPGNEGNPVFSIHTDNWLVGPQAPVYQLIPNTMPFRFHGSCAEGAQSIHTPVVADLRISMLPQGLLVATADERPLGTVLLFDMHGRLVQRHGAASAQVLLPTPAPGLYVVRTPQHTRKVVVP